MTSLPPAGVARAPRWPARAVLVASACFLGLAGCGDGGPSKESFVADADRICRADSAPLASVRAPTSFPELSETAGTIAAAVDTQLPKLRALDRPSGDDAAVDSMLRSLAGVSESAKALQGAASGNDEGGTAAAARDITARARSASDSGRAYGFATCGGSVQPAANASVEGAKTVLKAGYVVQAEQLCQQTSSRLDDLPEADTPQAEARIIDSGVRLLEELVRDLRALTPPPGDEPTLEEYFEAQQQVIDKAKEVGAA
ncbi:MAG TPA: hypothetical protein VHH09_08250, partial [Acidimicrobiales bacterium]|nr:hypothetical protein [Acidimicrobiales bacterium]